jgi:hypothetical protein
VVHFEEEKSNELNELKEIEKLKFNFTPEIDREEIKR